MGCGSSTPVGDDSRAPRPAKKKSQQEIDLGSIVLPEVTWERDEAWTEWFCANEKQAIEAGRHNDFLRVYKEFMFHGARQHLTEMYPECDDVGTIQDMGETHVCTGAGLCSGDDKCKHPTSTFLVIDACYSGIVHAFALMIAKPPTKPSTSSKTETTEKDTQDQQPWLIPGAELDSPEMRGAKHEMLSRVALMRATDTNVSHALIHIFIGADLITCRFDATPKPPTIDRRPIHRPKELIQVMNGIVKDTKKAPNAFRGLFAPHWFKQTVRDCSKGWEGSTVWDEGPLPFRLPNGQMYHEPTRLLVTRVYDKMAESVEEVSFTATPPPFPGTEIDPSDTVTLVRKADPTKEPGGIVRISLVIGINKGITWPKLGDYANTSTMEAGEKAVYEYAKRLHAKGVLDRCTILVYMGTDESLFKFVGDPIGLTAKTRALPPPSELVTPAGLAAASPTINPMTDKSLERDFNLVVKVQPKHELMGSESQFQAIKQYTTEKAMRKSPEELRAQAMLIGPTTARMILEVNFPNCQISDEGPFPTILPDGTETLDKETRLMVVRDSKQEPSSIVAAMNVVPLPNEEASFFSDKNWLETPEMKEADERLLQLLKRLHKQGKVSKVDCMALTMMVKDATIYQFVDGERFEDYSDERMAQFKWG
ncbi:uncharacterized protein NECHADRAFT_97785 [Fusarium vanettenii 77-13-4]|uniref:Uncharacterized protein n=1 Tax=Fusarium vanettenii (strain ATCC MYA-4622 / CBS 123669 / FGSC 9596 / NRRL 45880 / 77-13-4) TaxID=660122 RepID=C7Z2R4_FUSV7|nr:uncharacterized protein NECHADRAFT_97785 [Fusarium vanettenii 77-13-4]EEU41523.1 hypothetical protein NECHADRAFT_97785 [Fusarium vanettenii 77-13-4]